MKTVVAVALLLFVASQVEVEGRPRRQRRGLTIYDLVRPAGKPDPTKAPVRPQRPSGNSDGFNLEDALNPPNNGNNGNTAPVQADVPVALAEIKKKLEVLLEIENRQMRMLQTLSRKASLRN